MLSCGVETGFLTIQEAYAVGNCSIWSFYQAGTLRDIPLWCAWHRTFHTIHIWDCCTDPWASLLVFDASLSYSFGLTDGIDEWEAAGVWEPVVDDDTADADWFNFVMFRQWQIDQGIAW